MDWNQFWSVLLGAGVSLVATMVTVYFAESIRDKNERERRRAERLVDFQFDTLKALGDELVKLTRSSAGGLLEYHDLREAKSDEAILMVLRRQADRRKDYNDAKFAVDTLRERVSDDEIRRLVEQVQVKCEYLSYFEQEPTGPPDKDYNPIKTMGNLLDKTNRRIGKELRDYQVMRLTGRKRRWWSLWLT